MWMASVFRNIAVQFGYRFGDERDLKDLSGVDIFLGWSGKPPAQLMKQEFRGLHVIRDPRDIVISGARYHLDANEGWLKQAKEIFGGMSYQEALQATPPEKRFELELERGAAPFTLANIAAWNYEDPCFYETRYEDLVVDKDTTEFREVLIFLGIPKHQIAQACEIFRTKSLFSGLVGVQAPRHVRDGRPRQWEMQMNRAQGEIFIEKYGDLLIKLGYETNHDWVLNLQN
jgi:hypothetical protein